MITELDLTTAYYGLNFARQQYYTATETLIAARRALENKRMGLMIEGKITGKNSEEREASGRAQMADEYLLVERAESLERELKLRFEFAQSEVDLVRAQLRLCELVDRTMPLPNWT